MEDKLAGFKSQLIACIHSFYQKGWAPATSTNFSFRLPAQTGICITASGKDKSSIGPNDLMRVNLQGNPVSDDRKPSAETALHTLMYRLRPEARCVLHTHSVYSTVLSQLFRKQEVLQITGLEVQKGIRGFFSHEQTLRIPIFANSQDMNELADRIEKRDAQDEREMAGFLLAGHGLYTWGASIEEAKRHVEAFEFLLECHYKINTFSATIA
jgi:methylthioribulose-1-phosphate dehydratase